jgi:hypothetical protein
MSARPLRFMWETVAPRALRAWIAEKKARLFALSLRQALREQGLADLCRRLAEVVPDLREQYSTFRLENEYQVFKVRGQHAFQIALVQRALALLGVGEHENFTVVDIGDSAGTHVQYIKALYENSHSLSVNLDRNAVEKIRRKGIEALHVRAEDVAALGLEPDLFLSFETLEHLLSPVDFLRSLAGAAPCRALVVTVPYRAYSRVGLEYIRSEDRRGDTPEHVHVFEFAPDDWRLLFQFSGWRVLDDRVYLQYPRWGPLRLLKSQWGAVDFEGFYGAILERDDSWSKSYGWVKPRSDSMEEGGQ